MSEPNRRIGLIVVVFLVVAVTASVLIPRRDRTVTASGVSIRLQRGWHHAQETLAARSPLQERIAVGTYPLRSGATVCRVTPTNAIRDLPPSGALVWIAENNEFPADVDFGPRPTRLPPTRRFRNTRDFQDCGIRTAFVSYGLTFTERDRDFWVYVFFGNQASSRVQRQAWEVIRTMKVAPERVA